MLGVGGGGGGGFLNSKVRVHWVDNGGLKRSSTLSPDLCTSQRAGWGAGLSGVSFHFRWQSLKEKVFSIVFPFSKKEFTKLLFQLNQAITLKQWYSISPTFAGVRDQRHPQIHKYGEPPADPHARRVSATDPFLIRFNAFLFILPNIYICGLQSQWDSRILIKNPSETFLVLCKTFFKENWNIAHQREYFFFIQSNSLFRSTLCNLQ